MRQKGLALVLVLWVLTLLTIMAGSFTLSMRRESSIIFGLTNRAQAQAYAEAGLALAELMMLEDDPARRWRADGQIYEFSFDEALIRVRILAENGKVDINRADLQLLLKLLSHAPMLDDRSQSRVANAILDWRDPDDETREDGAEKKEYQAAGLSYGPRNQAFQSIEELQMVLGVDAMLYEWLEPFITIDSGQANVDINNASAELRYILESEDDFAARPISGQADADSASPRVRPFSSTDQDDDMSDGFGMQDDDEPQVDTSAASGAMTVVSEATVGDGITAGIRVLIRRSAEGVPFSVVRWQTMHSSIHSLFSYEMESY